MKDELGTRNTTKIKGLWVKIYSYLTDGGSKDKKIKKYTKKMCHKKRT